MAWNPFRREKALTASPAVLDGIRGGWTATPLLGGGSRDRIVAAFNTAQSANYSWIYMNSPAVRTVIDVLVRNVGQLDLRLYQEISDSERRPLPDHPAARSLRYPTATTTQDQFVRGLFKDFLIFDNAYGLIAPAPRGQITITRIPASMMEVRGNSLFEAESYRYWRADGSFYDFDPENILHWHGEHPQDPRVGYSRLETLRSVTAEDAALQTAIVELAGNGLAEPIAIKRPLDAPEWSNDARKGFEEDLTNRIRRRNKTPIVLEEGMEPITFGISPRDAQMFEVRRWAIERVAGAYGLPLGMVGLADNLEAAQAQFYADTLPPYCEDMTRMLDLRVCVRAFGEEDLRFEFNLDEKHMGDDRLKSLVSATGRPVMVTNEARALVNLPPVYGGDDLVTPLNVIVGEKPSVDVMPVQDPNGPAQDGSHREDNTGKALVKAERVPLLHPGMKADLERQLRNVERTQQAIDKNFSRLARSMKNKAVKNWDRWDREFADDINDVLTQIVEQEGAIYAFKLGGTFDMKQVKHYLLATAQGAATGINDTVRSEVDELGVDGALSRFPAHVASAGASLGAKATIWAREEAARQSPGYERRVKTWIPHTDRHAGFGGQTVPVGADWPAGFAPGSAPGCQCSMSIQ